MEGSLVQLFGLADPVLASNTTLLNLLIRIDSDCSSLAAKSNNNVSHGELIWQDMYSCWMSGFDP